MTQGSAMAGQLTVLPRLLAATIQKNEGVGEQKHQKMYLKQGADSSSIYQSESVFRIRPWTIKGLHQGSKLLMNPQYFKAL